MHARPHRIARSTMASTITATLGVLAGAAITFAVLLAVRPRLSGSPSSWRGDDLAFGATWLIAIVCAAWLALTTLACLIALARGHHAIATRIAGCAPPIARRILQAALVGTLALAPTAAHADESPPAPFTLHVGSGGRLTTLGDTGPSSEVPVVRAPATPAPTSPPSAVPTAPPHPSSIAAAAPAVTPAPPVAPARTVASVAARPYIVRARDNLWTIARAEMTRARGGTVTDEQVARYWQRVIAANRGTLRSGDPSLIFPGEVVTLPLD